TRWLARFESEPEGIDRDLIVSALRGERLMAGWPAWRRDPVVYLNPVLGGLLLPFLHRLRPEPELVEGVMARLAAGPGRLAPSRENLGAGLAAPPLGRRAPHHGRAGAAVFWG